MKRQLPKIAIKYSEENWKEIKKAVDYLRGNGYGVERRKDSQYITDEDTFLVSATSESSRKRNGDFYYDALDDTISQVILTMPSDLEKLKSYFEEEPKRGEVYRCNDRVIRFKNKSFNDDSNQDVDVYSQLTNDGEYCHQTNKVWCYDELTKATPEEEAKLIEAEHNNGYHWTGSGFVKIPEYVKCETNKGYEHELTIGKIYKVSSFCYPFIRISNDKGFEEGWTEYVLKASTRQAYEAQEAGTKYGPIACEVKFDTTNLEIQSVKLDLEISNILISKLKAENERLRQKLINIRTECES
ncbi:MAG: hypothetical protein R3243_16400 [Arenibacter latericius]|nr:hypothetical protein [Arenibacter latericius]